MALNLEFTAEDEAFRSDVRAFLDANLTDDLREAARRQTSVFPEKDVAMRWQKILHEKKGWAAPAWPEEFGGPGWSATQRYIFNEECARAGAPGLIPLGMRMLAPVLFRYGTPEQQAEYLPKMLSGEHYWCQGYSEPGSGSDLSSLQTAAVVDGDDYIVNGTKIWTTHGHFADHIFCLVRTDAGGKPQAGISFLLIDMTTPGISVQPIITIAGDHEVNQVFFDNVRVPQANRVGPENEGWTVAKYLLEFERGGGGSAVGLKIGLSTLRRIASAQLEDGAPLMADAAFAGRVAELEIGVRALEFDELRTLSKLAAGGSPGPESSLAKNTSVDLQQSLNTLSLEAIHYYGVPHHNLMRLQDGNAPVVGPPDHEPVNGRYLNSRAASIFGGSKEVQKNIIAKAVLGL
jgi:alkylation response protein AidB-like acyl-CoA dehydrogenase